MASDFVRPTPLQLLADYEIDAFESGKAYNENAAREYVNNEFEVNGWEHPDLPLPPVGNPREFKASEKRMQAIRNDDAEANRELAQLKAQAERDRIEREQASRLNDVRAQTLERENDDLRKRLAALEAAQNGTRPETTVSNNQAENPEPKSGEIGSITADSTITEMEEYAVANGITLPASGMSLNPLGKKRVFQLIQDAIDERKKG